MKQMTVVVLAGLFGAGLARADLLAPGTRNIGVEHRIETDKDYPDFVFFTISGSGAVTPVKLEQKTPLTIPGDDATGRGPVTVGEKKRARPYRSTSLVAVPKKAGDSYPSEKEFHAALNEKTVPGSAESQPLPDHENVKIEDSRKSIVKQWRVEKIDPKEGIVLTDVTPEEQVVVVQTGGGLRPWMVGLAGTLAVVLLGLWVARRSRTQQPGGPGGETSGS
jgi:hypothetical protein